MSTKPDMDWVSAELLKIEQGDTVLHNPSQFSVVYQTYMHTLFVSL